MKKTDYLFFTENRLVHNFFGDFGGLLCEKSEGVCEELVEEKSVGKEAGCGESVPLGTCSNCLILS